MCVCFLSVCVCVCMRERVCMCISLLTAALCENFSALAERNFPTRLDRMLHIKETETLT